MGVRSAATVLGPRTMVEGGLTPEQSAARQVPAREPLSVCVICCDEEANIRACLQSVAWADEIVVVDSGSRDNTVAIAREFTPRVIYHAWPGWVEQKNFALEQATYEWVLCIDADERVSPELAREIQRELERIRAGDSHAVGYSMPRRTFYLGRWISHGGWYPDRKVRLFRRSLGRWAGVNPHDHVRINGAVIALRGDLLHYTYRDIADHLDRINRYTSVAAREMLARRQRLPLFHMLFNPPLRFLRMYVFQRGFLDGLAGFIIAVLAAYYVFLKYVKLWELYRRNAETGTSDHGKAI